MLRILTLLSPLRAAQAGAIDVISFLEARRRRPSGHPVPLCSAEEVKSAECTQACHESPPAGDAALQTGCIHTQQVLCAQRAALEITLENAFV